jgi:4-amino-4-deoxy-L-arabinose transferase-like glycosyltransferase
MQVARRYLPVVPAAAAAALAVTAPTVIWESSTAYVDLALTLHGSLACYALARYSERKDRSWAILAATQFGLASATKHLGLFITAIALSLFAAIAIRSGTRLRLVMRTALLMSLLAATLPAPWYLRAWQASGNPVFPEMYTLFGASPPQRWDALTQRGLDHFKEHFGYGRSPRALVTLPWDMTVHATRFGGSLGPLFLLLIPFAAVRRRPRPAAIPIAVGAAAYMALWASPLSSFQLRFLMPIVPALALLAAAALAPPERAGVSRGPTRLLTAMTMGLVILNLPPFTRLHEADRGGWNGWLTHVLYGAPVGVVTGRVSEASYLGEVVPSWSAWQYINASLPMEARVLTFSGGDNLYADRQRLAHDATMARPAVWGAAVNELDTCVTALRQLGVTHVLFDRREMGRLHVDELAIASPPFLHACVAQFDDGRFEVCRIDYARLAAVGAQSRR